MKRFDFHRFLLTFRWFFNANRSRLTTWTIGSTIGIFILEAMFIGIMLRTSQASTPLLYWEVMTISMTICLICTYIAILVVYSSIFDSVNTKQRRIAFLMLPATNQERWLTALLYAIVVCPFCICLAFLVGDLLRTVFFWILGYGWSNGIQLLFENLTFSWPSWQTILKRLVDVSTCLWVASVYVLGGTWFRKRSFLIVSTIMIALMIGFAITVEKLFPLMGITAHIGTGSILITNSIIALFFFALSAFNFWLSYRIFCRFQVISSEWRNL